MAEDFGDKTEAPTAKRKREAVENGELLRSREFATALVVLAGVGWLIFFGGTLMEALKGILVASFSFGRGEVEHFEPGRALVEIGWRLAPSLVTLFAIAILAAILS